MNEAHYLRGGGFEKKQRRRFRLTPPEVLVLGFAALIFIGTLVLNTGWAAKSGVPPGFITALFTATSAVCVTGLVVVDTGSYWSSFGQAVILVLLQVGGLGIMTSATIFSILLGRQIGLKERLLIRESLGQVNMAGVVRLVRQVLLFTLAVEAFFAVVLVLRFAKDYVWPVNLWYGIFHAVSAFNNAGFDLFGGLRSISGYVSDPLVNFGIALPVIIGGLGFVVISELVVRRNWRHLSLHAKLTLVTTAALLFAGFIVFLALEYRNILHGFSWPVKLMTSFFQAVTPRTAGFSSVDIQALNPATQLFLCILMFVGASPGSTGGGIKTTTFVLLVLTVWSLAAGREGIEVFGRRIPLAQVLKAMGIFSLGVGWLGAVLVVLLITESHGFLPLLFEGVSAFGTVGLSTGITPELTPAGLMVIIATMFVGRLGPLTVAFAIAQRQRRPVAFRHPEEQIIVG
ncbi:MAG TPA: Trk family potassium uptake protein [Desulfotomaculum sp.]|nr:Trk family potassium uptake protein [Desulfotomaculum sp.]